MKRNIFFMLLVGIIILIGSPIKSHAQGITMYHMYNMPHKQDFNPALTGDFKFFLTLPGNSTGIGMDFQGLKIGSLFEDVSSFRSSISDYNYINLEQQYTILTLGFKAGKNYFTLDAQLKNSLHFGMSKDFADFVSSGNGAFIGETADFSGTGFSETMYLEYSLGYSRTFLDERLTIGGRVKYLNGIATLEMSNWDAGIYTAPATYELDIHSKGDINVSGPFDFQFDANNNLIYDSINVISDQQQLLDDYLLKNKNKGLGVDFGASLKLFEKLNVSASVTDFINTLSWNQNVFQLSQDASIHLDGVELNNMDQSNDSNIFEPLIDTIASEFQLVSSSNSFTTKIRARYYLGANYELLKWLNVGAVVSGHSYHDKAFFKYTLSANMKVWSFLGLSVSGSKTGTGTISYGAGLSVKLLPIQIYVIGENLTGFYYDPDYNGAPMIWPGDISHVYLKFGVNIAFGAKKKDKDDEVTIQ